MRSVKVAIVAVAGAAVLSLSAQTGPSLVDPNLAVRTVVSGLQQPTTMAFIGANDILVLEKAGGKVRMMGDGSADYTKKLGLETDLTAGGMGVRCRRFSMLVEDGVVKTLNIEAPGKFEASNAETMLAQARG